MMVLCRIVEFLINAIPVRIFQDILIRLHVQRCPRCDVRLMTRETARRCLTGEGEIADDPAFVRKVAVRAARKESSAAAGQSGLPRPGRWAMAAAGLVLVVGATIWFVLSMGGGSGQAGPGEGDTFRINYLNVDGTPADTLVIQPRESDLVIIWVDREFRDGEPGGRP